MAGRDGPVLRCWNVDDAPALVAAWSDADIVAGSRPPDERSLASAQRWIEGTAEREARRVAIDRVIDVGGQCVGEVGISDIDEKRQAALIGWWVGLDHRGNGFATAGVTQMVEMMFADHGLVAVLAEIAIDNKASWRVAFAAGFTELRAPTAEQPGVAVRRAVPAL